MTRDDWTFCVIIAIVVCAIFGAVAKNDFVLDADFIIRDNPRVQEARFAEAWTTSWWEGANKDFFTLYRPVTMTWFTLLGRISERPAVFNVGALLLHVLVALVRYGLLVTLLRELTHARWVAFGASLLAAVHGMAGEAVVGMVGAAEMLVALFTTLSWWSFTCGQQGRGPAGGRLLLGLSPLLFLVAVFCKENAVMFPAVLALQGVLLGCDACGGRQAPLVRRLAKTALWMLPFAAVIAVWMWARVEVLGAIAPFEDDGVYEEFTTFERITSSLAAMGAVYLPGLFWPFDVSPAISHQDLAPPTGLGDIRVILGILFWAAILLWTVGAALRRHVSAVFGALFIFTLLPTSNLIQPIGAIAAWRFLYSPVFALSAGAALAASALWTDRRGLAWVVIGAMSGLGIIGAAGSVRLVKVWKDDVTLAEYAYALNPGSVWAMKNRTGALHLSGRGDKTDLEAFHRDLLAFDEIEPGLKTVPSTGEVDPDSRLLAFQILMNRASYYASVASQKSPDEGLEMVAKAMKVASRAEKYVAGRDDLLFSARMILARLRFTELGITSRAPGFDDDLKSTLMLSIQQELDGAYKVMGDGIHAAMKVDYYVLAAQIAMFQNDTPRQQRLLAEAREVDPHHPDLTVELAQQAQREGDWEKALTMLEGCIEAGRARVRILGMAGQVAQYLAQQAAQRGDSERARELSARIKRYRRRALALSARSPQEKQIQDQIRLKMRKGR